MRLLRSCRLWPRQTTPFLLKRDNGTQYYIVQAINAHGSTCSLVWNPSEFPDLLLDNKKLTLGLSNRDKSGDRDIFNERPTREEQSVASASVVNTSGPSPIANAATIHTTLGDIHLRLFPQQAPKAVENFVGHARNGYFEGIIFHRVIPKFMIQTGDPFGDGTGGTSIWGREFEDEFSDDLKHDRWVFVCTPLTP